MLCALTVRQLEPGAFERFAEEFGPRESEGPPRDWVRFDMPRADQNRVVTFGFFDGTFEEPERARPTRITRSVGRRWTASWRRSWSSRGTTPGSSGTSGSPRWNSNRTRQSSTCASGALPRCRMRVPTDRDSSVGDVAEIGAAFARHGRARQRRLAGDVVWRRSLTSRIVISLAEIPTAGRALGAAGRGRHAAAWADRVLWLLAVPESVEETHGAPLCG